MTQDSRLKTEPTRGATSCELQDARRKTQDARRKTQVFDMPGWCWLTACSSLLIANCLLLIANCLLLRADS